MNGPQVMTRPLAPADLGELATLFDAHRNTRGCWCTAFCSTRAQFAVGWVTGGNRLRFESAASGTGPPMGVLAAVSGKPVGWCACGPRSRYAVAKAGRSNLLDALPRSEDESVWLVACLFVRASNRGQGVTRTLIKAGVEVARNHGAQAVEAWPVTGSVSSSSEGFVGRESVFDDLGFRCVDRPTPRRAIMRLELAPAAAATS